jgi:hypothetical protein
MDFARLNLSYGLIRRPDQSINVIACDKREALRKGALATKRSMPQHKESWIASLRSQ